MLTVIRTANAGVLLELDGTRILLDGVCREVSPYPATPDSVKAMLRDNYPDVLAVTHCHADHCDPVFEAQYSETTGRPVVDPEYAGKEFQCGAVRISVIPSRHIGKSDCSHVSFVIEGSCCVWFTGDASPNQWKNRSDLKKPDVLIAPYAYATTEPSWRLVRELSPKAVVLLHLPDQDKDIYDLWTAVYQTVGDNRNVFIPEMEEFVEINF